MCARDGAVRTAEMVFFASILRSQCYLQFSLGKNRECLPRFLYDQLWLNKSGWNNVEKLEIAFRRAYLIVVVPPNQLNVCGLFFYISEVLELLFHFIAVLRPYLLFKCQYQLLKMCNFYG